MILINSFEPKIIAIVPAAGIGSRMKIDLPKQYIKIRNRTILEHTLRTLSRFCVKFQRFKTSGLDEEIVS